MRRRVSRKVDTTKPSLVKMGEQSNLMNFLQMQLTCGGMANLVVEWQTLFMRTDQAEQGY